MESDETFTTKKLSTRQILLIGIVLVILIVILYFIVISLLSSHYRITKEVCHNETIEKLSFPEDFEQLDVCPSFVNISGTCFKSKYNDDVILKNGANYTTYRKVAIAGELPPVIKEVCEDIVYEFPLTRKNWCVEDTLCSDFVTKEWLTENCLGAISCYGTFEKEDISTCEFKANTSSKIYKCGDIVVEVLK